MPSADYEWAVALPATSQAAGLTSVDAHGEVDIVRGATPVADFRRLELPAAAVASDRFDDGAALFDVVRERGLEGVVAKRLDSLYLPSERGWVKAKNRETWWRYELEGALTATRQSASFGE